MARIIWLASKREMNGIAANHGETAARLERETRQIAARARANLAAHRDKGHTEIVHEHPGPGQYGGIDHWVHFQDNGSGEGEPAPHVIEFGGGKHNWTGKPIPGLYILSRAAGLV